MVKLIATENIFNYFLEKRKKKYLVANNIFVIFSESSKIAIF